MIWITHDMARVRLRVRKWFGNRFLNSCSQRMCSWKQVCERNSHMSRGIFTIYLQTDFRPSELELRGIQRLLAHRIVSIVGAGFAALVGYSWVIAPSASSPLSKYNSRGFAKLTCSIYVKRWFYFPVGAQSPRWTQPQLPTYPIPALYPCSPFGQFLDNGCRHSLILEMVRTVTKLNYQGGWWGMCLSS